MRRWSAAVLFVLTIAALVMSGCRFGGTGEIQTLELAASQEILGFGETAQLSAVGRTTKGKRVAVIADWEIAQGAGTLGESSFQASSVNYEGPVVLRASYQGVAGEITLTINGLLGADYPFPNPSSPEAALPAATVPELCEVGEPLTEFVEAISYFVTYPFVDLTAIKDIWSYFVRDGVIQLPELIGSEKNRYKTALIMERIYEEELLPEIPRLSHRVHYELIDSEILGGGTSFSQAIAYRQGTTLEQATALFQRLFPTMANSYGVGWSTIATHLAREIGKKTQEVVTLEQDRFASSTWSFARPDDTKVHLHSAWVRVDTFYLSDSQGFPLETSPVFSRYNFSSCPVEIRSEVFYVTWSF